MASFGRFWRRVERHRVDERGVPDLTTFRRPMSEYHALFIEGIREFDFGKRVEGLWGLIAKSETQPWLHSGSSVAGPLSLWSRN